MKKKKTQKGNKIWLAAGIVAILAAAAAITTAKSPDTASHAVTQEDSSGATAYAAAQKASSSEAAQSTADNASDASPEDTLKDVSGTTDDETGSTANSKIEINMEEISSQASYYDIEIEGTVVEAFAVLASDDTVRLAMNTCQVCNGSPYAYFEQDGDYFVCQNCGNRFSSGQIGVTGGGCNPVPITADDYTEENGIITISDSFLQENAYRFSNWKQF